MDRRTMLGMMGLGTIGVAHLSATPAEAAPGDKAHDECARVCAECAQACEMAANYCYGQVAMGKKEHAKPLRFLNDCAGFCGLSARNVSSMSPLMDLSCDSCGDACKETREVVAAFDSPEMKKVADMLKKCEASCREMVAAMGHKHAH